MGCSNVKPTLCQAIDEVNANPTAGFVNLHRILRQAARDASQLERVKDQVPHIFEVLPKAMQGLDVKSSKQMLAACAVIVSCVAVCHDPSLKDTEINIAWEMVRQTQKHLLDFLSRSLENSEVVKAIALALAALLRLEPHATQCKRELGKTGLRVALKALQTKYTAKVAGERGGTQLDSDAVEALALMLSLFADTPEAVATVVANSGNITLIPYVEEPRRYGVSKDMHGYCITVLEACLAHGRMIEGRQPCQWIDEVQAAINKGASAVTA